MAVVISGKTKIIREKKEHRMIKGFIIQGDLRTLNVYSL